MQWLQLSTGELKTFTFDDYCDHVHIELSPNGTQLQCVYSTSNCQVSDCHGMAATTTSSYGSWQTGVGEDAVLVQARLKPRDGSAYGSDWSRNRFTLSGGLYRVVFAAEECPVSPAPPH